MGRLGSTIRSSVGAKGLMAVTGIVLVLFVLGHMAGNLKVFAGRESLNSYAAFLKGLGPLLWAVRIFLLAVLVAHVAAAAHVVRMSNRARPVKYQVRKDQATNFAARTMWVSGILVALYLAWHLAHFTFGVYDPAGEFHGEDAQGRHDLYGMVIASFQHAPTAILYCVAQVVLAAHISHGASSVLQTLGFRRRGKAAAYRAVGPAIAAVVLVGNLSMPLAILSGLIP